MAVSGVFERDLKSVCLEQESQEQIQVVVSTYDQHSIQSVWNSLSGHKTSITPVASRRSKGRKVCSKQRFGQGLRT